MRFTEQSIAETAREYGATNNQTKRIVKYSKLAFDHHYYDSMELHMFVIRNLETLRRKEVA